MAMVALGSCTKVTLDTLYAVRTMTQQTKDGVEMLDLNVVGYAYFADTARWTVASAEDARDGIITERQTGEKRNYDLKSETSDTQLRLEFQLKQKPVILSVYDTQSGAYAWRHAEIEDNLPNVSVVLKFRFWRWEESPFIENRWVMNLPPQETTPDE